MNAFEELELLNKVSPYLNNLTKLFKEGDIELINHILQIALKEANVDEVHTIKEIVYYCTTLIYNTFREFLTLPLVEGIKYPNSVYTEKYLTMYNSYTFLLRPVKSGLIKYESLINGTVHLKDLKIMNDFLDVTQYNEYLANKPKDN